MDIFVCPFPLCVSASANEVYYEDNKKDQRNSEVIIEERKYTCNVVRVLCNRIETIESPLL